MKQAICFSAKVTLPQLKGSQKFTFATIAIGVTLTALALTNPATASTFDFERQFLAPDGAAFDFFGGSIALDGNNVLISSPFDDDNGERSGSVYLFDLQTGDLLKKITAPDGAADDRFGSISIALEGNKALIGALRDDDNGEASGSALSV